VGVANSFFSKSVEIYKTNNIMKNIDKFFRNVRVTVLSGGVAT